MITVEMEVMITKMMNIKPKPNYPHDHLVHDAGLGVPQEGARVPLAEPEPQVSMVRRIMVMMAMMAMMKMIMMTNRWVFPSSSSSLSGRLIVFPMITSSPDTRSLVGTVTVTTTMTMVRTMTITVAYPGAMMPSSSSLS